jgi:sugar-phosphatase
MLNIDIRPCWRAKRSVTCTHSSCERLLQSSPQERSKRVASRSMQTEMLCSAVLFDLDGVLVDSTPLVTRLWTSWASENGHDIAEVLAAAHGQRTVDTMTSLFGNEDAAKQAELFDQRELREVDGLVALPGARELLEQMPPGRWAVVTSGSKNLARSRMSVCGLPAPSVLVSAEDVSHGKPDPEGYSLACARLGAEASTAVVVEDTPAGVRAGRAAGTRVVAVGTTYPIEELGEADVCSGGLSDISLQLTDAGMVLVIG